MTFLKVILYPQGEGEKVDVFLHTCTISIYQFPPTFFLLFSRRIRNERGVSANFPCPTAVTAGDCVSVSCCNGDNR